jgi:hypothetical protein
MKLIDYSLIESDRHDELVEAVCRAITDGWTPCGGVCVWFEPPPTVTTETNYAMNARRSIVHYVQAMVRYE